MADERSAVITIGGKEYELLLTTKATKEIAKRYGGLENLGEKLLQNNDFEKALDEIVFLIVTLANQPILIDNYKNKTNNPLLTNEEVEILTTPSDLTNFKEAITECLFKGTKRNVESDDTKNAVGE